MLYRIRAGGPEVLLVHPGGPLWAKKDLGAWSIPKGELQPGESAQAAAVREFGEELGFAPPGSMQPLGTVRQAGGKTVEAWAVEGDCDPAALRGNNFAMEWPPRSGRRQEFPEVDRAEFFRLEAAHAKINPAQAAFLDRLAQWLADGRPR
ncbi:MAG: NUDIX domain-containing protein [Terriglobales bacterium]